MFGLGVGASESIDGDHERLEHAVFDERRLRGGVRRQRDSLQQQTEIAFGHGLRPVRQHGIRQIKQLATVHRSLGVAHRAALAAKRFHSNVNLRTTLRRGRRVRVRRYQTAGRTRAAEGRARTAPPHAADALTSAAAAAGSSRGFAFGFAFAFRRFLFGGGDFAVAVVIVVVVPVDVLHLGRAPPVLAGPATARHARAVSFLAAAGLLLLDLRLVRLEHARRGFRLVVIVVVESRSALLAVRLRRADPPATLAAAAVTLDGIIAVAFEVVVEGEFLAGGDVAESEDADAQLAVHHPLLRLAIWLARVVQKPARVAALSRVDRLGGTESHEVIVPAALLFVALLSRAVHVLVKNLADVLDDELLLAKRLLGE